MCSSDLLGLAIYDVTNAAWIQPAGCYNYVTKSVAGTFSATWQIPTTCSQYQVVIFTPYATGATTISFLVDEFYCGSQVSAIGPAMSDLQSFTPTGSYVSNVSYTGYWAQRGDMMIGRITLAFTGATTATGFSVNIPTGKTIDTTKYLCYNYKAIIKSANFYDSLTTYCILGEEYKKNEKLKRKNQKLVV